ncbi:MAG: mechanosensitive ion channel [Proteobacteria bacterium]|nr:mechanosensitive ion channel [Pseudomonadota bacterium]
MKLLNGHGLEFGGASLSFAALLTALGIILVGFLAAAKVASRIRGDGRRVAGVQPTPALRWRTTMARIVGYTLRGLAVVVALQVAGVDLASVLAASAVVAVGVGIAMQKVAENFVSGIVLHAERSIRQGDIIEFEGHIAKVEQVGIRATIARTIDDEEIIVPNSILTQSPVKNLTLTEVVHRLRVRIGVAYGTDLDRAAEVLRQAAESLTWRERTRDPVVLLVDFGSSSVDFEASVWTRDVWGLRRGQSDLRRALWRALRAASITIPFPQVDVHFDAPTSAALEQALRSDQHRPARAPQS